MKTIVHYLVAMGFIWLVFINCKYVSISHLDNKSNVEMDTSAYQIVGDLLTELRKKNNDEVNYVFNDSTDNKYSCNFPVRKSFSEKIDQAILKSLFDLQCSANKQKHQIDYNFIETYGTRKYSYLDISTNNLDKYLSDNHSVIVNFSKPTISIINNYALIYLSIYASNLNADGSLYLLKKENNTWKIFAKNLIHYN